jgi:hypothetical protein
MPRCPTCGFPLPQDRNRVGARCLHCRSPLYQSARRLPRDAQPGEPVCTTHPGSVSVGTCGRCGNFLCETCRTRWGDLVLCAACVDRALRAGDTVPGAQRIHTRQAAIGLSGGLAAWLLLGAIAALAFLLREKGAAANSPGLVGAALLILLVLPVTVIVALFGVGYSAAALRARGDSMILATLGLLLSGLYVGTLVGVVLFAAWLH